MKKLLSTFLFFIIEIVYCPAQKWIGMMDDPAINFYDVQKEFYSYYNGKARMNEEEPRKDGPYTRFKSWEYEMLPRVHPTGIRPDPKVIYAEWLKQKAINTTSKNKAAANWSLIGPSAIPSNGGGAGKANCVAIDPANTQHIWLGTSGGGVWKSVDGGNSWSTNTDQQLPSLAIFDLLIDPVSTNNLYLSLREGVFKSTDSGATWINTGFNKTSYRLEMDPSNPSTLLSSCLDGLYRTTDGGVTWTQVLLIPSLGYRFKDIEFNPGNPNIVYACTYSTIHRSTDNGITWTTITAGLPVTPFGIKLAVSPANPNYVYGLFSTYGFPVNGGFYALCRSTDAGLTWATMSSTPNILGYDVTGAASGGQGSYCMSLAVSPLNANEVYAGGINLWKSTDGGVSWTVSSDWTGNGVPYVHADQQDLKFQPGSGSVLYAANDGGINASYNGGTTWTDLSNGLEIMEMYNLSSSATDPDLIVTGSQDNGTNKSNSGVFSRINYGDGFKCIIDYTYSNTIYTSYQSGALFRSIDGGTTNVYISPGISSSFFTNFSMNPLRSQTLYAAFDDIYRTYDGGDNWTPITSGLYPVSGGAVRIPVVAAPSDTNTIYVGKSTELYRTTNGGITWDTLASSIPPAAYITGLAVHPTQANTVWICCSGYAAYSAINTERILKTTDGGTTWTNITYTGLPAVPLNCIVYQDGTPDAIYVGTDLGVYYIDNTMSHWAPYNTGLPNVKVMDLDIQYATGKLRAATFGRGLWESNLNVAVVNTNDAGILSISNPKGTICNTTFTPVVELKNFGSATLTSATIKYQIDAGPINTFVWAGSIPSFASNNVTLPAAVVTGGQHTLSVNTILPNAVLDLNTTNDSATSSFTYPVGLTLPYSEGFESATFPPNGITINNPDLSITWDRTTAASFTGNASAFINDMNYANDGMLDEVILPYFNFTAGTPILTFEYAYQLRADPVPVNYYTDTLAVEVSTDCSNSWTLVYKKFDLPLVTTTPTFNTSVGFIPASAADWALESINLSAFSNNNKVLIKFKNINGRGNNLYLDDINLYSIPAGIQTNIFPSIDVYPNPNNGVFIFSMLNGKAGSELIIYNVLGKLIYTSTLISGNNSIDMSDQIAGMYFYKVTVEGKEVVNGKIVIQ